MRFTVGETYTFARTIFTPGSNRFGTLYLPWEDTLIDIEVINLRCIEHHKVPGSWDDVPKNDGFIFLDEQGNRWANQYPTAHYGQLDDSNDRMVRRHFMDKELLVYDEDGEIVYGNDGLSIKANPELWKIFESHHDNPFVLATESIGKAWRAINDTKPRLFSPPANLTPNQKQLLQEFLDAFVVKVETVSGKKVSFQPFAFKSVDGESFRTCDYVVANLE